LRCERIPVEGEHRVVLVACRRRGGRAVKAQSTPASRSRPMASNTLLRGASISATASSEDGIGAPRSSARILAAALPRRTGPVNSRHWLGIS
jgi:hypothetical protein